MRFAEPQLLAWIPIAMVALGLFFLWALARKRQMLSRFGDNEMVRKLTRGVSHGRQNWKYILLAGSVAFLLFALARPQYGAIERPLRRRGVEVVIAIDCSRSMLGQDIKPSRMARARQQLRGLIERLEGDNVGIVAFAGIPIIQCPMTSDYDMALSLLESVDVDSVPVQGTAIGPAIRKSFDVFQTAGKGYKVLVLLTDGEDHEGDAIKAAEEAAKQGVVIYAIGIGTPKGVPIPLPEGGYKESDGGKVNTRLDFDLLRQISAATGGKAILANPTGDLELREVYRDISSLKEKDLKSSSVVLYAERFQYFLAVAIILLAAEMLVSDRKRRIVAEGAGRFD